MPTPFAVQPIQERPEPAPPVLEPCDPMASLVPWSAEIRFDDCEVVFTGPKVGVFRATNESGRMGADFDLLWMGLEGRAKADPGVMKGWSFSQPEMGLYGATREWYLAFTRHGDPLTTFTLRFLDAPVPQALIDFLNAHLNLPASAGSEEGEPHDRLGDEGHDVSDPSGHSGDAGWHAGPALGLQAGRRVQEVQPQRHTVVRRGRGKPRR